jgi:hypothetical protein
MLNVRIFYTTLYIGKYCSCFPLNPFLECECRNSRWRKKQTCRLVTYLKQFTTFGSKNMGKEMFACMLPP